MHFNNNNPHFLTNGLKLDVELPEVRYLVTFFIRS